MTLNTLFLFANPVERFTTWLDKGYKEFRTHPRIDRAYTLIKQGKEDEAKKLLEKVLEIDSKNSQAKEVLLELCLKRKDEHCINRYLFEVNSKSSSIGYIMLHKAKEAKKHKEYKKVSEFVQKAMQYPLKKEDILYAKELLFDSYLKQHKYLKADKLIGRYNLLTLELFKWSKVSSNLNEKDYAYALASELPNKEEYLKWKLDLLLANKKYKKASVVAKKLYDLEPNNKRLEELIYLYKITKQDEKMIEIYKKRLAKRCDSYALLYLFESYKSSPKKKLNLLNKNYPFSCLKKSNQVVFTQELVHLLKYKNPKKAKRIANKIIKHLKSNKARLVLFQESGQYSKMRDIYLQRLEHGCNKEALTFLLEYEKKNRDERRVLLDRAYPYECFSPKKRSELTMQLVMLSKKEDPKEIESLLDGLNIDSLDKKYYLSVANLYKEFKRYKKSNRYLLRYIESSPNNTKALKSLGYNYLALNQKDIALAYFIQASKYNQEDGELLKNIGYLCLELNQPREAIAYWKRYLKSNPNDPNITLQVSKLYFELKKPQEAMIYLSKYEKVKSKPSSEYHWLKGKLAFSRTNCIEALKHYEALHKMKPSEVIDYEYIQVLKGCGESKKAIELLSKLSNDYPTKIRYKKELAYLYKSEKDYNKAIEKFKIITKREPKKFAGYVELASLEKKRGASKKVVAEAYKMAIDNAKDIPKEKLKYLKREIAMNSKSFHIYASEVGRLDGYKRKGAFTSIPNRLYNGFGFIEFAFQPHFLPKEITLFANVIHDQHNFKKSLQPSIGVRYKPLKDKELYLSAQQMIKAGEGTRNETLLRASLGISGKPVEEDSTIYNNLYLDANYFVKNRSKVLYGNYELGKEYRLSDHTTISPYTVTGATLTTDNTQNRALTNFDIGVGVALSHKSGETHYEDSLYTNKLKLEARQKYAGNSKDENTIRLQWEFLY